MRSSAHIAFVHGYLDEKDIRCSPTANLMLGILAVRNHLHLHSDVPVLRKGQSLCGHSALGDNRRGLWNASYMIEECMYVEFRISEDWIDGDRLRIVSSDSSPKQTKR